MNQITHNDAAALSFVQGQAYKVNQTVYEARFPDWDFGRLVFVDTSGPAWAPGILTYTSDISGNARWQSGYAKDVPMADVSQEMQTRAFELAAIGYQYNIEEVNTALNLPGASLPSRRARAARLVYTKFMWDLTLKGDAVKGLGGLINYPGVPAVEAPADGTAAPNTAWVLNDGTGNKTPEQIVRDVNIALTGVMNATNDIEMADTLLMPVAAYNYIASTPFSAVTMETILTFLMRTNVYTIQTGQPLTIRAVRDLSTAATEGASAGAGRLVAYKNDENYVKLHLPMPHQFLPVYQDGPLNFAVPGIFRTGGIELLTTATFSYVDGITPVPA